MAEVMNAPMAKADAPNPPVKEETPAVRRPPTPAAIRDNPRALLRRFGEEMDRFFEGYGLPLPGFVGRGRELLMREAGLIPADWSPRIEVGERDGRFLVRVELPGLSKDDIQVDVQEGMLTIRGERKQEKSDRREGYAYSECSYGGFYRAVPLPEGVDASEATAELRDGVLEVAMPAPNRTDSQARRLDIQQKA